MMELHSNLGGAVFNTMARLNSKQCRSAVASCHGSGVTFELSAGGTSWFALHLLACWPA